MNSERINIHELTVEEPEKQPELLFDPEKEITEEDWLVMKEILDGCRSTIKGLRNADWERFSHIAMYLKILNPTVDLGLTQKDWKKMKEVLSSARRVKAWSTFYMQVSRMKVLDPEINIDLGDGSFEDIRDDIQRRKKAPNGWDEIPYMAMDRKILFPDADLNMSADDWQKMREILMSYKDENGGKGNWLKFSTYAMVLKTINPNLDLGLTPKIWQNLKESFEENRKSKPEAFVEQATALKILAAEEVKITENGFVINMVTPKKSLDSAPPVPETKRF